MTSLTKGVEKKDLLINEANTNAMSHDYVPSIGNPRDGHCSKCGKQIKSYDAYVICSAKLQEKMEAAGFGPDTPQEAKDIFAKAVTIDPERLPYVSKMLRECADLFAERNAVYKDNFRMVGRVMQAMFPEGITIKGEDEFNRWHLFELSIVKLTRYAIAYKEGGHKDSLDDMIVYAAMVAALDAENGHRA